MFPPGGPGIALLLLRLSLSGLLLIYAGGAIRAHDGAAVWISAAALPMVILLMVGLVTPIVCGVCCVAAGWDREHTPWMPADSDVASFSCPPARARRNPESTRELVSELRDVVGMRRGGVAAIGRSVMPGPLNRGMGVSHHVGIRRELKEPTLRVRPIHSPGGQRKRPERFTSCLRERKGHSECGQGKAKSTELPPQTS